MSSQELAKPKDPTFDQPSSVEARVIQVLKHFLPEKSGTAPQVETIDRGLINPIYKITHETGQDAFVLRQINRVFDAHAIDSNLQLFLKAQADMMDVLPPYWQPLDFIPVVGSDEMIYSDETGISWMLMKFIPGFIVDKIQEIPSDLRLNAAYSLGAAVAYTSRILNAIPVENWGAPLPDLHNLSYHYHYLHKILNGESPPLALSRNPSVTVSLNHDFYNAHKEEIGLLMSEIEKRSRLIENASQSAVAVQWNDCKLNNTVFRCVDGSWQCVCLIDPDTMQLGQEFNDLADALRSAGNPAGESPLSLDDVRIDKEIVDQIILGYLTTAGMDTNDSVLRRKIIHAYAGFLLRIGIRFLADALVGNKYFKLKPGDPVDLNLYRARVQFKALEKLEEIYLSPPLS
jgi:hypothetical protein